MLKMVAEVYEDGGDDESAGEGYESDAVIWQWRILRGWFTGHIVYIE